MLIPYSSDFDNVVKDHMEIQYFYPSTVNCWVQTVAEPDGHLEPAGDLDEQSRSWCSLPTAGSLSLVYAGNLEGRQLKKNFLKYTNKFNWFLSIPKNYFYHFTLTSYYLIDELYDDTYLKKLIGLSYH